MTSGVSTGGAALPIRLRSRSVGQVGRNIETTLGIARFHDKVRAPSGATADQFEQPSGAAHTGYRKRSRRQRRHPPSRHRSGRLAEVGCFRLPTPSPHRYSYRSGRLGREVQPARSSHGKPSNLGDDSAQSAVTQSLLEAPQQRRLVAGFDVEDAVRAKSSLRQCRGEQVRTGNAPQNFAGCPRCDSGREQRCRGAVDGAVAATGDFVQGAIASPPPGSRRSIASTPNGNTGFARIDGPSRRSMRSRSCSKTEG
jgi:hypothetical protein